MNATQLIEELNNLKAYKKDRVRLGVLAVEQNVVAELIDLCKPESGLSHQACWSLEQSFLLHEESCYPYLKEICALYQLEINSSGMRALCKIARILSKQYYGKKESVVKELLTYPMRERMVEGCFQELISTDKTANMAFAVYSLFEFGKEFEWIYPELKPILKQKLSEEYGNGFKSSARTVIAKIDAEY